MSALLSPSALSVSRLLDGRVLLPVLVCAVGAGVVAALGANERWFLAANTAAVGWLPVGAWAGITTMGSPLGAFALLAPTLARWPRWTAAALLAAPLASVYTHVFKEFANVPRPAAVLAPELFQIVGLPLRTSSFPSGHTLTIFVLAGVLALCARRRLAWCFVPVAALVAFSRIAVGAHWPLDLFGGAAGGWAAAACGCAWSARWRFWEGAGGQRALAAVALVASVTLGFEHPDYPEGLWMQYLLCAWGSAGALYALWRPAAVRPAAAPERMGA
ncbi:MAG: phosphatase PAP2 family protein [Azoarcus sp.]|jgi:membrane-associated phospholipid phosphatase|nr:phosphatase PAP2 family protein [Azoarcus sp.]